MKFVRDALLLPEQHPLCVKLERVFELMDELGIKLVFPQVGGELVVESRDDPGDGAFFVIRDSEWTTRSMFSPVPNILPPQTEYVVAVVKDER